MSELVVMRREDYYIYVITDWKHNLDEYSDKVTIQFN